jgi:hypothetical protein
MSGKAEISKLQLLVEMILDQRLSVLRKAAQAKQDSEAVLAGLACPEAVPSDLHGVSSQLAGLGYQRWADARRSEINVVLARQTVEFLAARDEARVAFGKADALSKVAEKLRLEPRRS